MRIPAGRTAMTTRVENPADHPLELEITVNGTARSYPVPAGRTVTLTTPLAGGATRVAVTFRGDRRLVLLETAFVSATDTR
jgi:hypothetical protein